MLNYFKSKFCKEFFFFFNYSLGTLEQHQLEFSLFYKINERLYLENDKYKKNR